MPVARIVSDHPIIASSAAHMLSPRFEVHPSTWAECEATVSSVAPDLVVLDITHITGDRVLSLISRLLPRVRVLVTSLDRNQVDVYEITQQGLSHHGELPSLLSLRA